MALTEGFRARVSMVTRLLMAAGLLCFALFPRSGAASQAATGGEVQPSNAPSPSLNPNLILDACDEADPAAIDIMKLDSSQAAFAEQVNEALLRCLREELHERGGKRLSEVEQVEAVLMEQCCELRADLLGRLSTEAKVLANLRDEEKRQLKMVEVHRSNGAGELAAEAEKAISSIRTKIEAHRKPLVLVFRRGSGFPNEITYAARRLSFVKARVSDSFNYREGSELDGPSWRGAKAAINEEFNRLAGLATPSDPQPIALKALLPRLKALKAAADKEDKGEVQRLADAWRGEIHDLAELSRFAQLLSQMDWPAAVRELLKSQSSAPPAAARPAPGRTEQPVAPQPAFSPKLLLDARVNGDPLRIDVTKIDFRQVGLARQANLGRIGFLRERISRDAVLDRSAAIRELNRCLERQALLETLLFVNEALYFATERERKANERATKYRQEGVEALAKEAESQRDMFRKELARLRAVKSLDRLVIFFDRSKQSALPLRGNTGNMLRLTYALDVSRHPVTQSTHTHGGLRKEIDAWKEAGKIIEDEYLRRAKWADPINSGREKDNFAALFPEAKEFKDAWSRGDKAGVQRLVDAYMNALLDLEGVVNPVDQ